MKRCPVFVFAGAESDALAIEIWCAARLVKLEVGRGFDRGDDIGIHRLPSQYRRRVFQESTGAWGSNESPPAGVRKTR